MHKIYTVTMFFFSFVAKEHLWCNNSNIEIKKNVSFVLSRAWDKGKILSPHDTRQVSRVTPSFTLEEPLGLLMMRLKSNFKLWKHLTGL